MNREEEGLNILAPEPRRTALERALTRRQALTAGFGGAAALYLAACGGTSGTSGGGGGASTKAAAKEASALAGKPIEGQLLMSNWVDYVDPKDLKSFRKALGPKVTLEGYGSNDELIAKLSAGGSNYDVIVPSGSYVPECIQKGLLMPLDHSLIPNLKNLSAAWQSPTYDAGNTYSVPNFWWTTGYAWDPRDIPGDLTSWAELWDPSRSGKMEMLDDLRECFAAGAFRLGLSPNTKDLGQLDSILQLLEQQKPLLRRYTATDQIRDMVKESVQMAHCWSGDWVQMTYDKPRMKYVIPSEGSIKGNDVMIITSGAQHPIAAHLWLDFNLDGQISAENTNYIGYMGPNDAALPLIEGYIKDDSRLNPPPERLAELIELEYLQPADLAQYTDRWNALKA